MSVEELTAQGLATFANQDQISKAQADRRAAEGKRVQGLMARLERNLAREYVLMIRRARARLQNPGTVGEARAVILDAATQYAKAIEQGFLIAANLEMQQFGRRFGRQLKFDPAHSAVARVMYQAKRRFVLDFTAEQMRTPLPVIRKAERKPSHYARIREGLGLTPWQESIVANYRRNLEEGSADALDRVLRDRRFDRTVERAVGDGEPLSTAQIDRMTERYRDGWVSYRARTIAKTQASTAVNGGRQAAFQQVAEQANFDTNNIIRVWNAVQDNQTRDSHAALDGEEAGFDEPFQGDYGPVQYPGDPGAPVEEIANCRCWLEYSIAGLDEESEEL